jgi:hypothetical protein
MIKIIVKTEEQKQDLLKQSQYIHEFLVCPGDVKELGKNWIIGLDSNEAGTLMHLYTAPHIIEVNSEI